MRVQKTISPLIAAGLITLFAPSFGRASTFWTGPSIGFYHSETQSPIHNDAITADVVISRNSASGGGLINTAAGDTYGSYGTCPTGTKWVTATLAQYMANPGSFTFGPCPLEAGLNPPHLVSPTPTTFVVHLTADDIYLQLTITNWGGAGGQGAGDNSFGYIRSTAPVVAPAITITNPVSGAIFPVPGSVTIGANATVSSGTVTNVTFYTNNVPAGAVLVSPFKLTVNNLAAGAYALKASATAGGVSTTSAVVNITVSIAPTVTITNPPAGAVFAAPANVSIDASATVAGGSVTNVQFFTNGVSLKSVTLAPFSATASSLGVGSYTVTAVATAGGLSTTSTPVAFGVATPPTIAITNPPDGSSFPVPATVTISASASAAVTNVQFFTNSVLLGTVTVAPFTATANNLDVGTYALTAVATASGLTATSSIVHISVLGAALSVSVTNPAPGAVFAAPAVLKLGATASGGAITNVQFFANTTTSLGAATAAPFTVASSPLSAGAYSLSAVATAGGISATSTPVNVSVINPSPITAPSATVSGGMISFNFSSDAGLSYVVQSSSNLLDWVSVVTNTAATNSVPFSNPATNPALFYRIGLVPNP